MQNLRYYVRRELIMENPEQKIVDNYNNVMFILSGKRFPDLTMKITTHRIIFIKDNKHSLLLELSCIIDVESQMQGCCFGASSSILIQTIFNDKIKLILKNDESALVQINGVINKGLWKSFTPKKEITPSLFAGIYDHEKKMNTELTMKQNKVNQSFQNFENLFQNAQELKQITLFVKNNLSLYDESFDNHNQLTHILNDMGFIAIISKQETGKQYYVEQAKNIFKICTDTLFKQYGGMVSLLDLFYFYNKKRQTLLISPEEILKACEKFQDLGLPAKIVTYQNNIKIIESTTYDPVSDFDMQFNQLLSNDLGITIEQLARKRGIPTAITQVKINAALKRGRIVRDDRIEGIRYYNNLILQLQLPQ